MNAIADPPLTERQKQVLALMAEGLCRKEIAARLGLSVKTVEYFICGDVAMPYKWGIFHKLKTNSVALLTQWALRNGIAEWKV